MDPKKLFVDDRTKGFCAYCGGTPNSRDHVPSKILLDTPYPENLPVTESCSTCNQGFSASEEYLACLIECIVNGTTTPNENFRPKIAATLKSRPSIANKIERSKQVDASGTLIWQPKEEQVREVILKLSRGHIAYELGVHHFEEPELVDIFPLVSLSENQVESFFALPSSHLYPEIGSRAFVNICSGKHSGFENWIVVQKNRYQYSIGQSYGDWVKIVINDYLACHVAWN